jgi:ergothioneine biosynthesis protein EgtB
MTATPSRTACSVSMPPAAGFDKAGLSVIYRTVRAATESLCAPLAVDDYGVQSMSDTSPVKWHLAHTTWFFETFLLEPFLPGYRPFHPQFREIFNSYYNAVGPVRPRDQRGTLSRPTVAQVKDYRGYVDEHVYQLLDASTPDLMASIASTVVLGVNHEQQHQELILTDLKHAWAASPLTPVYQSAPPEEANGPPRKWLRFSERLVSIGHEGEGFAFDNEAPRHRVFLRAFHLASSLVTCAEYLAFIAEGGYERPELWLSDGWAARQAGGWTAPLYWSNHESEWHIWTLSGEHAVHPAEPVCHVSFYEADAFARWAGARLPTEAEWETAAEAAAVAGHFLEARRFHPAVFAAADDRGPLFQLCGDVWQWTASPYIGYPGYQSLAGALGEYNGKFMSNKFVLRGASCVTPRTHARRTYRNFFAPEARWQFSGLRLARDG